MKDEEPGAWHWSHLDVQPEHEVGDDRWGMIVARGGCLGAHVAHGSIA